MFDLKDFQAARKTINEKRASNASSVFSEVLKMFDSYAVSPTIAKLEQIGKKLAEILDFDKEFIPAYLYLSFVFYALGNEEMALKYFRTAEQMKSSPLPQSLLNFREEIVSHLNQKRFARIGV